MNSWCSTGGRSAPIVQISCRWELSVQVGLISSGSEINASRRRWPHLRRSPISQAFQSKHDRRHLELHFEYQHQENAVDISEFVFQPLREDEEFILYRGRPRQTEASSILLLTPALKHSRLETLTKINDEYALKSELDTTWAVRPRDLSQYNDKTALVLEDPGGDLLHGLIRGPMEIKQFLRLAIGLTTALSQLHKRSVMHKDLKPSRR